MSGHRAVSTWIKLVFLATFAVLFMMPAFADDDPCDAAQVQTELNRCWNDAATKAASDLAQRQSGLDKIKVSAGQKELLRKERAAWDAYAQAHCSALSRQVNGGSSAPTVFAICQYRLAKQRASDVDILIEDLSR